VRSPHPINAAELRAATLHAWAKSLKDHRKTPRAMRYSDKPAAREAEDANETLANKASEHKTWGHKKFGAQDLGARDLEGM
jgi:hypothetical protein